MTECVGPCQVTVSNSVLLNDGVCEAMPGHSNKLCALNDGVCEAMPDHSYQTLCSSMTECVGPCQVTVSNSVLLNDGVCEAMPGHSNKLCALNDGVCEAMPDHSYQTLCSSMMECVRPCQITVIKPCAPQ